MKEETKKTRLQKPKSSTVHKNYEVDGKLVDKQVLLALRGGSHDAFKQLYMAYKESIQMFLVKLLRSQSEAEDLTQEIFAKVWERRDEIDVARDTRSFLFTVAKNSAYDLFRHKQVRNRHRQHTFLYGDRSVDDPKELLVARETELIVKIVVSNMPERRKHIFQLSRFENLSNQEIADKLNMNVYTVANHISNALKDIREVLPKSNR